MCESCSPGSMNRRQFMATTGAITALGIAGTALGMPTAADTGRATREKQPARVAAVFLYPPADAVHEGRMEDSWAQHRWFTYPSYQFQFEEQERLFTTRIREISRRLGVEVSFAPEPLWQDEKVREYAARTKQQSYDAVLVVNFYNSLSGASIVIATEAAPTAIVYTPVGAQHQLPNQTLDKAEGLHFVQGIEDWDGIEEGLRAVRAKKMLAQSRLLRVRGAGPDETVEAFFGTEVVAVTAAEYNELFDSIEPDREMRREAMAFKRRARRVEDVSDEAFIEALRAHKAVQTIMERHGADAITIECLMLEHRKPCVSFCLNNGGLTPCGCENDLNATLTLMLGRWLMDRGGFQHNPGYNPRDNQYFGSHCTCALDLHGPDGPKADFWIRPFTHQLPKTPALDVQWRPGEEVMLGRYHSGEDRLTCWTGKVVGSPTMPPTGGCATRVLVEMDGVEDVRDVYPGPHPVLFCGSRGEARRWRAFARMYHLQYDGNVRA
jgi:hypothetical protein